GAEDHLVIAALRAAESAGHPGFVEDGASFHVPARGEVPGAGQVIVEYRFRMVLKRHRLAAEEMAPERVARIPHVNCSDVRQLVVHKREEALARREGLHRQREGRYIEQDHVAWAAERGGVAVVGEV